MKVIIIDFKDRTVYIDAEQIIGCVANYYYEVDKKSGENTPIGDLLLYYGENMDDTIDFMTNSMNWVEIDDFVIYTIMKPRKTTEWLWDHSNETSVIVDEITEGLFE